MFVQKKRRTSAECLHTTNYRLPGKEVPRRALIPTNPVGSGIWNTAPPMSCSLMGPTSFQTSPWHSACCWFPSLLFKSGFCLSAKSAAPGTSWPEADYRKAVKHSRHFRWQKRQLPTDKFLIPTVFRFR